MLNSKLSLRKGFNHSVFSCEFSGKLDDETSQKVLEYERTLAEAFPGTVLGQCAKVHPKKKHTDKV